MAAEAVQMLADEWRYAKGLLQLASMGKAFGHECRYVCVARD